MRRLIILFFLLVLPTPLAQECTNNLDCNDCNSWTQNKCDSGSCGYTAFELEGYESKTQDFLEWMRSNGYSNNIVNVYESDLENGALAKLLNSPSTGLVPSFEIRDIGRGMFNPEDNYAKLLHDYKNSDIFEIKLIEVAATDADITNSLLADEDIAKFEQYMTEKFMRPIKLTKTIQTINYLNTFGACTGCDTESSSAYSYKGKGVNEFIGGSQPCEDNGKFYYMAGRTISTGGGELLISLPTSGVKGCNAVVSSDLHFTAAGSTEAVRWTHEYAHVLGVPHMTWDLSRPYLPDEDGRLNLHKYMFGTDSIMFIPGYVGQYRPGFEVDSRGFNTMIDDFDPLTLYLLEPVSGYGDSIGEDYSKNARYNANTILDYRQEVCGFGPLDEGIEFELVAEEVEEKPVEEPDMMGEPVVEDLPEVEEEDIIDAESVEDLGEEPINPFTKFLKMLFPFLFKKT